MKYKFEFHSDFSGRGPRWKAIEAKYEVRFHRRKCCRVENGQLITNILRRQMQTRFHTRCHGGVCLNLSAKSTHGPYLPELSPSQSFGTEMASHLRSFRRSWSHVVSRQCAEEVRDIAESGNFICHETSEYQVKTEAFVSLVHKGK